MHAAKKYYVNTIVFLCSMRRLLVTVNVPSSPILVTQMMEVLHSSETWALTGATWRNIPEDRILQKRLISQLYTIVRHLQNLLLLNAYFMSQLVYRFFQWLRSHTKLQIPSSGDQYHQYHCITKGENEGFELFTAAAVKNGVFWDVTPCGSCTNRRFGGT
jgi:hypothetical protein